jgi:hypothetical protein
MEANSRSRFFQNKNLIYYLLGSYAVICILTIKFFNGTGDSGDSIAHYLFARYAPKHPELYFDHWAKPMFVLLASPFAQFGFTGMKVFNVMVSLCTMYFTYLTARHLDLKNPLLVVVFMSFSPLNYILTFSGLTEPLFALFVILGVWFCLLRKYTTACIVISFLPYVRSEGLIVIGVFFIYLLFEKQWKRIPLLLTGSVLYGISGAFIYGDLLWVFTKIPYATLGSVYGSGGLFHFGEQLVNVMGVPLYVIFWIGFLALMVGAIKKRVDHLELILIFGGFVCFFMAHTLFWYLGIFNSMGLKRVFLGIMPLMALITLYGYDFLAEKLNVFSGAGRYIKAGIIVYLIIFPFVPNPSAIWWERDMMQDKGQILAEEVATFLKEKPVTYPFLYNYYPLSMALDIDHFDPRHHQFITKEFVHALKPGNVIIWDNIHAKEQSNISKQELDSIAGLQLIASFSTTLKDKEMDLIVYKKE